MNESGHRETADAPTDSAADLNAQIASLRTAGAERFDPVRLHYIDVLARRASAHQGNVRRMLDAKLAQALEAFKERFDHAQRNARKAVAGSVAQYPDAADALQSLLATGDFNGLRRLVATLKTREQCAALGALVRRLDQHPPENADARPGASSSASPAASSLEIAGSRSELKTIRNFRNTWSKLSVDKQVTQALEQAPANAGPINSHMLALRSLALMRDISPDYLNRFMSYADTLLCLDQCEKETPGNPRKPQAARVGKNKSATR